MVFESFAEANSFFLLTIFFIALVMGAIVTKTNFCTMGAISDMTNMSDFGRMRAWVLAMAVGIIGVVVMESTGVVDIAHMFPPYRGSQLIWAENLLGGILFGIGMTLGSGCGNKTLIRIGGGNIKSIMVLFLIGIVAYYMINPFPDSDKTLMSVLFYDWIRPLSISLKTPQDLGSMVNASNPLAARQLIGGVLAALMLIFIFKSSEFRKSFDHVLGGLAVGVAVLAAWYASSGMIQIDIDGESYGLMSFVNNWDMLMDTDIGKPALIRPSSPQSFTFVNPMGQTVGYIGRGFNSAYLTFGLMAVAGVISGSFIWSLLTRSFRIEWFASFKDFGNHLIGGLLMGFGGTLALGCTIGQGVTGISTLALGSFIAFFGIVFGSAMTMKIQLYKMMYEDASMTAIVLTSLADMKLLPNSLRKLESI
ncbi:MAG TPA: YeeE/YedE family protein [Gammaproteobacteria bacterium]|nr:YeeE/YedE family protein [Gammaproteobacteria bacterium]